jgi:hypothetical protein
MKKECSWKGGALPSDALTAFQELQTYLCSEPIVDHLRKDQPYTVIVNTSLGDEKKPGGLRAILTQLNKQGEHCVIAYASRKLQKHECNYTPFLLEMQGSIWGMEHFATYLLGWRFSAKKTSHNQADSAAAIANSRKTKLENPCRLIRADVDS